MRCLERDPAARYQSAYEILADLQGSRGSASGAHTVQIQIPEFVAQRRWTWVVAGVVALLLLAFAIPPVRHLVLGGGSSKTATSTSGIPPLSQGKFVAILPFRIPGDDQSLGYVAEGLNEALSSKLFQLKDLRLASDTAVAKVSKTDPIEKTARALGVNLIVQGIIQGSADKMAIIVNLIDVADGGKKLWSQQFTGVPKDLLTLEDQIYASLVNALKVKTTPSEMSVAGAHPTENVAAYDIYLRGRQSLRGQQDPKNIQAAIDLFEQAIKMDSGFALAYTGLSDASMLMYREKKDRFWSERGIAVAKQAERLNPKLPEVHLSLGSAYSATGQTTEAITELKKALELSPNSDEAYRRLGLAYADVGQYDPAIQTLKKAADLNPYYWVNLTALGTAYFMSGDYEKALKQYQAVTLLEPDNAAGYDNVGSVYSRMGKYEESITAYQKALQIQPYAATYSNLATAFFYLKRYPEAVQTFEKAVQMNPGDETYTGNLADAYRWAGQKDKANASYDKAISLAYKQLQVNPRDATIMGHLALYYGKKGDTTQAKEFIKRARSIDPSDVYSLYISAVVDTIANEPKPAIATLRTALQKGFSVGDVESEPEFAPLRLSPDYQAMIKQFAPKGH